MDIPAKYSDGDSGQPMQGITLMMKTFIGIQVILTQLFQIS